MEEALEDTGTSESEQYEVEEIVSHNELGNGYEYLLKWKGYPSSDNSWHPEEDLDCPDLVEAYWKRQEANGVTKPSPQNEKKSTPPKVTKPDKQAPKDTEKKQRKRQPKPKPKPKSQELEVIAVAMKNGELHFLCKDGAKQIVKSNKVMKSKHPQELFAFYEKHIEFGAPVQQNK